MGVDFEIEEPKGLFEIWNTTPGHVFLTLLGVFVVLMFLINDT